MKTKRESELSDVKLAPPRNPLCDGKSRQGGVAIDRDGTLGFAASDP